MTSAEPMTDEWLTVAQAAELADVSTSTWRRATLPHPTRKATAPAADYTDPVTGTRRWLRTTVAAYLAARGPKQVPGNPAYLAEGRAIHAIIDRAIMARVPRSVARLAAHTGLSYRTVRKHLEGACGCAPD